MLTLSIMLAEKKKPAAKIFDESDLGRPLWNKSVPLVWSVSPGQRLVAVIKVSGSIFFSYRLIYFIYNVKGAVTLVPPPHIHTPYCLSISVTGFDGVVHGEEWP